jgi:hypothetical protein
MSAEREKEKGGSSLMSEISGAGPVFILPSLRPPPEPSFTLFSTSHAPLRFFSAMTDDSLVTCVMSMNYYCSFAPSRILSFHARAAENMAIPHAFEARSLMPPVLTDASFPYTFSTP